MSRVKSSLRAAFVVITVLAMAVIFFSECEQRAEAEEASECTVKAGVVIACGSIYHYTPDSGYDNAIKVRCTYGDPLSANWVYEGENSKKYCRDTDQVYVGAGEEIWCDYGYYDAHLDQVFHDWKKAKPSPDPNGNPGEYMDATGWYKINNVWDDGRGCTKRKD